MLLKRRVLESRGEATAEYAVVLNTLNDVSLVARSKLLTLKTWHETRAVSAELQKSAPTVCHTNVQPSHPCSMKLNHQRITHLQTVLSADRSCVLHVAAAPLPPTLLSVSLWPELYQVSLVDRCCCFSPAFLDFSSELCSPICCCSFWVSLCAICSQSRALHLLTFWQ